MNDKSVVIIDTPNRCRECMFSSLSANIDEIFCCGLLVHLKEEVLCIDKYKNKPDWCPLVPLPERKDLHEEVAPYNLYQQGYNDCLDDIQKGIILE